MALVALLAFCPGIPPRHQGSGSPQIDMIIPQGPIQLLVLNLEPFHQINPFWGEWLKNSLVSTLTTVKDRTTLIGTS